MKVSHLLDKINEFAPFSGAFDWDNCGLLAGDGEAEVKGVYITLDADLDAVREAKEKGCNVIVSHHPIIFSPLKSVLSGSAVYECIRAGISVISAHTNLDCAAGGVADCLAKVCSLEDVTDFCEEGKPLGRIGSKDMSAPEFADMIKHKLGTGICDCVIASEKVQKVCCVPGSGGSTIYGVKALGCDTLVTGEAKYDQFLSARQIGLNLIALGHFETERIVLAKLAEVIGKQDFAVHICQKTNQIERR